MARIVKIEDGKLNSTAHPTSVVCAAQLVDDGNGNFLVQLASFGSKNSTSQGTQHVTQTYQFGREAAAELVGYFIKAFGPDIAKREVDSGPE